MQCHHGCATPLACQTYKSVAAGLALGGDKGLIIADSHTEKSEALLRAFGRSVESPGGRYYTTEDVGIKSET